MAYGQVLCPLLAQQNLGKHGALFTAQCNTRVNTLIQAQGLSHISRRKVTSTHGTPHWKEVTSGGKKLHQNMQTPVAQRRQSKALQRIKLFKTLPILWNLLLLSMLCQVFAV